MHRSSLLSTFSFCSSSSDKLTRAITADCWERFLFSENRGLREVSDLVFYAQPTITVISGRRRQRTDYNQTPSDGGAQKQKQKKEEEEEEEEENG